MIAIEHGDAMGQAVPQRAAPATIARGVSDEGAARAPQATEVPPVQAKLMRVLQQAVRDRAMRGGPASPGQPSAGAAVLQRQVKIQSFKGAWLKNGAKLPDIPDAIAQRYQAYVLAKVRTYAAELRDDRVQGNARTFATADSFYQPLFDRAVSEGQAGDGNSTKPWGRLAAAVEQDGNLTEVPWSSFANATAGTLLTELLACPVQRSTSGTTAYHANKHQKLPKTVRQDLDELAFDVQAANTPYVEFLIAGHKRENGIERGILDRIGGQVYITAHYDHGSIVWLSGAPANLVADWRAKATAYDAGN